MKEAYCRWYGRFMRDLAEHQQEQCEEYGQKCDNCQDLVVEEPEGQAENEEF